MKTKSGIIFTVAALAVLALSIAAHGTSGPILGDEIRPLIRHFIFGRIEAAVDLRERLNVTPEQKGQVKHLVENRRDDIGPCVDTLIAKKRALGDAIWAEPQNEAAIRQAAEELGQALGDAGVLASSLVTDLKTVLTPQQQKMVDDFRTSKEAALDGLIQELKARKTAVQ